MLDPKEEKRFAELKSMCRELKVPPPPEIMIGLKVHDKNGILTFDDIQRGHSWTRNYWNCIAKLFTGYVGSGSTFGAGYLTTKTLTASVGTTPTDLRAAYFQGGLGAYYPGIAIGTGDTAFGIDQYTMVAQIATGTGSGQMIYNAQSTTTGSYVGETWTSTTSRIFNNNSGGSITVKEVGLYSYPGGDGVFMMERSVLSPTVTVANGAQLTVTYEISMDFSAID
jgi:hypothetical protein